MSVAKGAAVAARAQVKAAAASAPAKVWMVSPAFDLTFFVGTALVVLIPWIAIEHYKVNPFLVVAGVAITANGPHLISTWTRVYLDGNERFKRPIHYWLIPAAIAATVVTFIFVEGRYSRTLRTVLFYWAFWHFAMQNWGILRIYQRRAGDAQARMASLERLVLWLGALWPMMHRLYTGPRHLFGAEIMYPRFEPWMVNGVGILLVIAASTYVTIRAWQWTRGEKVALIRPLFLLSSWFGFFVPFVLIKQSGSAAFAAAACWHGLQYLGIVWFYNRNRWKGGLDPKARLVSWISQPGRVPFYFLSLLAIAGTVYGGIILASKVALDAERWGSMVWMSLTFGHYWLDGVIWKLRKPELQKHLVKGSVAA